MADGRTDDSKPVPGFQGSETTGVEVTLYRQSGPAIKLAGRARSSEDHSLVAVTTTKSMGQASGRFSLTVKQSMAKKIATLLDQITDDVWVDIVFTRHGRKWHVMRGLVDDVRRAEVMRNAATLTYTISGRDFAKIFENTSIWFNRWSAENANGGMTLQAFQATKQAVQKTPAEIVEAFLLGFVKEMGGVGRSNWTLPKGMPGGGGSPFPDVVKFDVSEWSGKPERFSTIMNIMFPEGAVWGLAQEWSDPLYCELFCDLADSMEKVPSQGVELSPDESVMAIHYRDRPFILVDPRFSNSGKNSPWFSLPEFILPREMVVSLDLGKSGQERVNAFFAVPLLVQEILGQAALPCTAPLWYADDMKLHGMRRMDSGTKYTGLTDIVEMTRDMRARLRDWYCLNHKLMNGTVALGISQPDLHIGSRFRIPGAASATDDLSGYVEQVSHSWSLPTGAKTTLGVTRVWNGTDNDLLMELQDVATKFSQPPFGTAGA